MSSTSRSDRPSCRSWPLRLRCPLPLRQQQILHTLDGIADLWLEMAPAARKALCRSLLKEIIVKDGVITASRPRLN